MAAPACGPPPRRATIRHAPPRRHPHARRQAHVGIGPPAAAGDRGAVQSACCCTQRIGWCRHAARGSQPGSRPAVAWPPAAIGRVAGERPGGAARLVRPGGRRWLWASLRAPTRHRHARCLAHFGIGPPAGAGDRGAVHQLATAHRTFGGAIVSKIVDAWTWPPRIGCVCGAKRRPRLSAHAEDRSSVSKMTPASKMEFRAPSQVAPAAAPLTTVSPAPLVGTWTNNTSNNIVKAVITDTGGKLEVNLYGACTPSPCNWALSRPCRTRQLSAVAQP
jgi:hypothetical protein